MHARRTKFNPFTTVGTYMFRKIKIFLSLQLEGLLGPIRPTRNDSCVPSLILLIFLFFNFLLRVDLNEAFFHLEKNIKIPF